MPESLRQRSTRPTDMTESMRQRASETRRRVDRDGVTVDTDELHDGKRASTVDVRERTSHNRFVNGRRGPSERAAFCRRSIAVAKCHHKRRL